MLAPGLSYRCEVDSSLPRVVHALRFTPGAPAVEARVEVAGERVYLPSDSRGREELSALVTRSEALIGVNGDFFPWTGDPLGAMVRNGELVSAPDPRRAVFAWGTGGARVGKLTWKASVVGQFDIDALNAECPDNGIALFTGVAGEAQAKVPCVYAVIDVGEAQWTPTSRVEGRVYGLFTDLPTLPIEPGRVVIAGRGAGAIAVAQLRPGASITVSMETTGFDWSKVDNVIGGGPFLVRAGKPAVDWKEQGFISQFAQDRHPRTAVGYTVDGDVWFVAIDGRQATSVGATLAEAAAILVRLGCVEAINLDGGGSTGVNLRGVTLNRPSDGSERKIANGVLIFVRGAVVDDQPTAIQGPPRVLVGETRGFNLVGADGRPIPNAAVTWAASGSAIVDQGGYVRGLSVGTATLRAFANGRWTSLPLRIESAEAAPPPVAGRTASGGRPRSSTP